MTRKAKTNPKRIVFAEGADIKTLMAVQEILSEKIAHPYSYRQQNRDRGSPKTI